MKKLNLPLIGLLGIASLVLLVSVKLIHDLQVQRHADRLSQQADLAKANGDMEETVKSLRRYLLYRPDDAPRRTEATITYISLLEKKDFPNRLERMQAMEMVQEALKDDEENPQLQWAAAQLFLQLRSYLDARNHLERLDRAFQNQPTMKLGETTAADIKFELANTMVELERRDEALDFLRTALGYATGLDDYDPVDPPATANVKSYALYADLLARYRQEKDTARRVVDHMVAAFPEDPAAYLERAKFLETHTDVEESDAQIQADLAEAQRLAPESLDVIIATALNDLRKAQYDSAIEILQQGKGKFPNEWRIYYFMGRTEQARNELDAALKIVDEGLERMRDQVNLWIARGEIAVAKNDPALLKETIQKLKPIVNPIIYSYFEAERQILDRDFRTALTNLQELQPKLGQFPQFQQRAKLLTAVAARALGKSDIEQRVYESSQADFGMAYAVKQEELGQYQEALPKFVAALEQVHKNHRLDPDKKATMIVQLQQHILQCQIGLQLQLPESERQMDEIRETANQLLASDKLEDSEKDSLKLAVAINLGRQDKSRAFADECLKKYPDDAKIWALALMTRTDFASADEFLDRMEAKFNDSVAIRIRRAELITRFRPVDAAERLQQLTQNADALSAQELGALRYSVGTALARVGRADEAYENWKLAAGDFPDNVQMRMQMVRLAMELNKPTEEIEAWVDSIAALTSQDSDEIRYMRALQSVTKAHRAQVQNEPRDQQELEANLRVVNEVLAKRPTWRDMQKVAADLELLTGNPDRAASLLMEVHNASANDPQVAKVLASLLLRGQRLDDALRVLDRLGTAALTPELLQMKSYILERQERYADAVPILRELVEASPADPKFGLILGRMLRLSKDYREAEKVLAEYTHKAPEQLNGWLEYVQLLVDQNRKIDGESTLLEAQLQLRDEANKIFLRARGETILGNLQAADEAYRELVRMKPNDLSVLQLAASFYLDHQQTDAAKSLLDNMLKLIDASEANGTVSSEVESYGQWARRSRAAVMAESGKGNYSQFLASLDLLQKNAKDGKLEGDDLRVYLQLAASRPDTVHQANALAMLRDLETQRSLTLDELFIKAQLLLAKKDWVGYKDIMLGLVGNSKSPQHWNHWITNLLRRGEYKLARQQFSRYPPGAPGQVPHEIELLLQEKNTKKALERVQSLVPPQLNQQNSLILVQLSRMLEEFSKHEARLMPEAEKMLQEYVKLNPDHQVELALFYGRHWETLDQALAECERLAADPQVNAGEVAQVIVRSLHAHHNQLDPSSPQVVRGAKIIDGLLVEHAADMALNLAAGEVADIQKRYDRSFEIYQKLIDSPDLRDDVRAQVLNNMAYGLYLEGKSKDALPLVDEAIRLLGNLPGTLDTRAVINLSLGGVESAIQDLRTAVELVDDPLIWLHLAHAEAQARNLEESRRALEAAQNLGLDPAKLDDIEQKTYNATRSALESSAPSDAISAATGA